MSFWLSLSSAMPHTSLAGECPCWCAFFGRYEGFSTRCAWRQMPHPVRDATAYFREFPKGEVRRIPILRTSVDRSALPYLRGKDSGYVVPCKLGTVGG